MMAAMLSLLNFAGAPQPGDLDGVTTSLSEEDRFELS